MVIAVHYVRSMYRRGPHQIMEALKAAKGSDVAGTNRACPHSIAVVVCTPLLSSESETCEIARP